MAGSSHGHTPAAWTGVTIAFIGFCVSGVGMVAVNFLAFYGGLAVVVLGGIVGMAMSAAGMGMPKESPEVAAARNAAANKQVNLRSEDVRAQILAQTASHEQHHEAAAPLTAQAQTV